MSNISTLLLTRKTGESISIVDDLELPISVTVLKVDGDHVHLGVEAPSRVAILPGRVQQGDLKVRPRHP